LIQEKKLFDYIAIIFKGAHMTHGYYKCNYPYGCDHLWVGYNHNWI